MTHSDELYFNCIGRRLVSCTTRDAKEIVKPLAMVQ